MKIILDPGHGGDDPGAIDPATGLTEKYANLVTAFTLKHYLAKAGHDVIMTRTNDARPSFSERTQNRNADLLLSIHYDWVKGRSLLYYPSESALSEASKVLAQKMSSLLVLPVLASVQSPRKGLYIDDYKEGRSLLWEVDKINNFMPSREYRIEKCVQFVTALSACVTEGVLNV